MSKTTPPSQRVTRRLAVRQAQLMLAAAQADPHIDVRELGSAPLDVLLAHPHLSVRTVAEHETPSGCGVAGAYILGSGSPIITVATSTSPGRRAFTALHEFGHHLQQTDLTLAEALLDQPDGGRVLEEAACDSFAAAVLLPDDLVSRHIGPGGPTTGDVAALWADTAASRAAACVRASERLISPGHVLLIDLDGGLQFGAAHQLPPVRRGTAMGHIPVVREALESPSLHHQGRTRLPYRDGILGDELYAQAGDLGDYIVLVATQDRAPWLSFAPPSRDAGPVGRAWACEHCGEEFNSFGPSCRRCAAPSCPECGRCSCVPQVAERVCASCFMASPAHLFAPGSDRCRDCA